MHAPASPQANSLAARTADRAVVVSVIGLGYVGLPLARVFVESGFQVLGFDTDPAKVEALASGHSYIRHVGADSLTALIAARARWGTISCSPDRAWRPHDARCPGACADPLH